MKSPVQFMTYIFTFLWDVTVAWPVVILVRLLWGRNLRWEKPPFPKPGGPVLVCEFKEGSWPNRTWFSGWAGVTLGHAIVYNSGVADPDGWSMIQEHEHVHVEQYEGSSLGYFFHGLWVGTAASFMSPTFGPIIGVVLWWTGPAIMVFADQLVALMRGEDAYAGSSHEESAYAQADEYQQQKQKTNA